VKTVFVIRQLNAGGRAVLLVEQKRLPGSGPGPQGLRTANGKGGAHGDRRQLLDSPLVKAAYLGRGIGRPEQIADTCDDLRA
jgi:ABC-type branched-subunit amino acid transport system ATPase component